MIGRTSILLAVALLGTTGGEIVFFVLAMALVVLSLNAWRSPGGSA